MYSVIRFRCHRHSHTSKACHEYFWSESRLLFIASPSGNRAALGEGNRAALGEGNRAALGEGNRAALGEGNRAALAEGKGRRVFDGG
jgi:hypothetical protein